MHDCMRALNCGVIIVIFGASFPSRAAIAVKVDCKACIAERWCWRSLGATDDRLKIL